MHARKIKSPRSSQVKPKHKTSACIYSIYTFVGICHSNSSVFMRSCPQSTSTTSFSNALLLSSSIIPLLFSHPHPPHTVPLHHCLPLQLCHSPSVSLPHLAHVPPCYPILFLTRSFSFFLGRPTHPALQCSCKLSVSIGDHFNFFPPLSYLTRNYLASLSVTHDTFFPPMCTIVA